MTSNDTLRRRLMIATVLAESVVVPVTAYTAFRLAGGDLAIAAPLLAVSALEATRIPLSSYATKLKPIAKLTAIAALAGIGVLTGEVMATGFSALLSARTAPVTEATAQVDAAREALAGRRAEIERLTAEAAAARAELVDLSAHPPALSEVRSQTCAGRRSRGSYDCTPVAGLRANAAAQAAFDLRLQAAQAALGEAEKHVHEAPDLKAAEEALRASEGRLRAAAAANPMARLAAGLGGELDRVRTVASISLGFAVAFATSLLAFIAHLEPRSARPGKIHRAIRALAARWRRRLVVRRDVPGPWRDRVIVRWVPYDVAHGVRAKPADVESGTWGRS